MSEKAVAAEWYQLGAIGNSVKTRKGIKRNHRNQPAKRKQTLMCRIDKQDDTDNGKNSAEIPRDIRF